MRCILAQYAVRISTGEGFLRFLKPEYVFSALPVQSDAR